MASCSVALKDLEREVANGRRLAGAVGSQLDNAKGNRSGPLCQRGARVQVPKSLNLLREIQLDCAPPRTRAAHAHGDARQPDRTALQARSSAS